MCANLGELQSVLIGATHCLDCRDPRCVQVCPEHLNVPAAMRLIIGRGGQAQHPAWMQVPDEATASAGLAIQASFEPQ
ncbi:MAG: hypothetical protein HY782_16630 [Chloroflexi bacterium]|nr:hypothetical protein [Chloroflexota bacterium]